ncbi:hypothetical protein KFE25_006866 [Diacronema lutheri]|uniref:Uncharacterized protein n=1 Tax=Diacronema lutheri TaxID=2081491 RepID=A0A8J6CCQ6_DIALT|nr:hypothetical protein KFE25_006866 [Diacronema lutheri]
MAVLDVPPAALPAASPAPLARSGERRAGSAGERARGDGAADNGSDASDWKALAGGDDDEGGAPRRQSRWCACSFSGMDAARECTPELQQLLIQCALVDAAAERTLAPAAPRAASAPASGNAECTRASACVRALACALLEHLR